MKPWLVLLVVVLRAGDATLEGTVSDSVTKTLVSGASVSMAGRVAVETDPSGGFRFPDFPGGGHQLTIRKPGYATAYQNVKASGGTRVLVELIPLSDVEGLVLGEDGKPLAGVNIYSSGGQGALSRLATSDREGRFRASGLAPGVYRIVSHVPRDVRKDTAVQDAASGEHIGYRPVQDEPMPLTITGTVPSGRLDLRLQRGPLVDFNGTLVDAQSGRPLANAVVELNTESRVSDGAFEMREVDPGGRFRFEWIAPGEYNLAVYRAERLPYILPVSVGDAGVKDAELRIPPNQSLRVALKVPHPDVAWEGEIRITLQDWPTKTSYPRGKLDRSDPVLASVPPGQWRIDVECVGVREGGDPPRSLYLAAMRFGSQDARERPVTVGEAGNPPLELVLTDETGRISGTVAEDKGRAMVMVSRAASPGGHPVKAVITEADGTFTVDSLPADEYRVTAMPLDGKGAICTDRAETVKVRPGQTSAVHLRACPR